MTEPNSSRHFAWLALAAGAILMITMGARQTAGLFLLPITKATGVSIVSFSFALAVGQFVFGAAQPVFGVIADKIVMPKTSFNVYLFAAALGVTWLATVPPTSGIVGKLFGTRYLATLFGLTLVSHQVGGFLGAWLGGVVLSARGSYEWIWYADIALALLAAVANLPIREAPVLRQAETA